MALVALAVQLARVGHDVVEVAARQAAVAILLIICLYVEVDRTVRNVGEAPVEDPLHESDLLDDVARGAGLDRGGLDVERIHRPVVALGVKVRHLHRFELFEAGFARDLVLAVVGIVLQVPHVGDVAHVAHLVAERTKVAEQQVESHGRARMAQVRVAVDRGTAHVHAHMGRIDRLELLLAAGERIVKQQLGLHGRMNFPQKYEIFPFVAPCARNDTRIMPFPASAERRGTHEKTEKSSDPLKFS